MRLQDTWGEGLVEYVYIGCQRGDPLLDSLLTVLEDTHCQLPQVLVCPALGLGLVSWSGWVGLLGLVDSPKCVKKKKKKTNSINITCRIKSVGKKSLKSSQLRRCLICVFKQLFSVFKKHFTYFYALFYPHIILQIFSNNNFQFLNKCTKRP